MRSIAHFMAFGMLAFQKSYVLGEQYLLEQHLIRTKDGEDAVPKSIQASQMLNIIMPAH
jgi:hypothetical protein